MLLLYKTFIKLVLLRVTGNYFPCSDSFKGCYRLGRAGPTWPYLGVPTSHQGAVLGALIVVSCDLALSLEGPSSRQAQLNLLMAP